VVAFLITAASSMTFLYASFSPSLALFERLLLIFLLVVSAALYVATGRALGLFRRSSGRSK